MAVKPLTCTFIIFIVILFLSALIVSTYDRVFVAPQLAALQLEIELKLGNFETTVKGHLAAVDSLTTKRDREDESLQRRLKQLETAVDALQLSLRNLDHEVRHEQLGSTKLLERVGRFERDVDLRLLDGDRKFAALRSALSANGDLAAAFAGSGNANTNANANADLSGGGGRRFSGSNVDIESVVDHRIQDLVRPQIAALRETAVSALAVAAANETMARGALRAALQLQLREQEQRVDTLAQHLAAATSEQAIESRFADAIQLALQRWEVRMESEHVYVAAVKAQLETTRDTLSTRLDSLGSEQAQLAARIGDVAAAAAQAEARTTELSGRMTENMRHFEAVVTQVERDLGRHVGPVNHGEEELRIQRIQAHAAQLHAEKQQQQQQQQPQRSKDTMQDNRFPVNRLVMP